MNKLGIYIRSILLPVIVGAIGVSYGILKSKNLVDKEINLIYYTQLIVNSLWSFIFFVFEWRFFAIIWIILLLVLVAIMIKKFYEKDKTAGLLQIPYLLWVLFATFLTISIYNLNK